MSIWMYVIREMEDALSDCKDNCKKTGCNDDTVWAWDEAVAYYTGSLEGIAGEGTGKLLYALADKRCKDFKTCGETATSTEGRSHVNQSIIRDFTLASRNLAQAKCSAAREYKEKIEVMMSVPLIQGTLRYAYITNMKTGQANKADFVQVKKAFESVYDCMGVRGSDVGGLWNQDAGDYYAYAQPLKKASATTSSKANIPLIIGCTAAGIIAGIIVYVLVSKCCCSSKAPTEKKKDPMDEEDAEEKNEADM